jgi:hypothetical protein
LKRIFAFAPVLLLAAPLLCRADWKPHPCALQKQVWQDTVGAAEQAKAADIWRACTVLAKDQQKVEFAETRNTWATSLDKLPAGGWMLLMVSEDGRFAVFGSLRHATREGNVVSVWERWEFREDQTDNSRSSVVRKMYDCARVASKPVSATSYPQNNLGGGGLSRSYDEKWDPAIPGSMGDQLLDWACKTVPRSQPAKAQ